MQILDNVNLVKVSNAKEKVGIRIDNNKVEIRVPNFFRVNNNVNVLKKDLLLFLKSISIAKSLNYSNVENGENDGGYWPIEAYIWIIRDYLENGFYYSREKKFSNEQKGKIDWKRTLNTIPIISNGNLIYNELITSKMSTTNDIIAHIYKVCLKQSIDRLGWLIGYKIPLKIKPVVSVNEMIYKLKKELSETFDDVKRIRFRYMLSILQNLDDKYVTKNDFNYSIENYYYVFEQMVDRLFKGISGSEKKKYNPSGYWKLNNQNSTLASNLRPDTIYKHKDEIYILDAKMYQYGYTHNVKDLPETSSMQKQITYGDYIFNQVEPNSKVRNVFILPYDKEKDIFCNDENIIKYDNGNMAYIGEAYVDWRKTEVPLDHERIFAFLIDFNYLINNYSSKNESIVILINQVNEMLKYQQTEKE